MKSSFFILFFAIAVGFSFIHITSCTKTNTVTKIDSVTITVIDTVAPKICEVSGTYVGTNLTNGVTGQMVYELQNNNLALGLDAPNGNTVTYAVYTNTCDSVTISGYYTLNSGYYILQGKLSNNAMTISGSYLDVTANISGTFTMTKQ